LSEKVLNFNLQVFPS